jgi:hypothetical protein
VVRRTRLVPPFEHLRPGRKIGYSKGVWWKKRMRNNLVEKPLELRRCRWSRRNNLSIVKKDRADHMARVTRWVEIWSQGNSVSNKYGHQTVLENPLERRSCLGWRDRF